MKDTSNDERLEGGPLIEVIETNSEPQRATSLLSKIRKQLRGGRRAQREEFGCMLEIAHDTARQDPLGLPLLVKLIGRVAQARAMTELLRHRQDAADCDYDPQTVLFNTGVSLTKDGRSLGDLKREILSRRALKLGVDLILPCPWNREGLIRNLSGLRIGGTWGKWRQDWNHRVELWLPMGIGWVFGGNHSIAAGILQSTGQVKPEITYDISDVYDHVTCDGLDYRRSYDGSIIDRVSDLEMAAIFEIGRIMLEHDISS